jgi:plasmid stabilization system protein ParE
MNVEWTLGAISDLASIYQHIASDSARYAVSVVDRMTHRTHQLSAFPLSGCMVPEYQREDVREVLEYSYRIIYHVGESQISILAVIHGASTLPELSTIER